MPEDTTSAACLYFFTSTSATCLYFSTSSATSDLYASLCIFILYSGGGAATILSIYLYFTNQTQSHDAFNQYLIHIIIAFSIKNVHLFLL